MKKVFTVIAIMISFSVHSQNWPLDNGKILFTGVVKVDSTTQNILFTRANEWFAKTYNDSKAVIQMNDKDAGKIVSKGTVPVSVRSLGANYPAGYVHYTLSIMVKDGRYKYEITDLYHSSEGSQLGAGGSLENTKPECGGLFLTQKQFDGIKQQAYDLSIVLIESLNLFMAAKSDTNKDSW